jgi:hypothetical protein
MQYITNTCAPQCASCANLVIAETKYADVQTNVACNVTATFRCLIQAVRLTLRLPLYCLSPFSVCIFIRLSGSSKYVSVRATAWNE